MFGFLKFFGHKAEYEDDVEVYEDPDPYDCSCDTDDFCHECGEEDDDDFNDDDD